MNTYLTVVERGIRMSVAGLLLGMILLGCNQERQTERTAPTPPEAAETAAPAPGAAPAQAADGNLVPDSQFNNLDKNWKVVFQGNPTVQESATKSATLPGDEVVPCLMVRTDQSAEITMNAPVAVSPEKTYRFSVWVKQDAVTVGQRFFGPYFQDGNNNMLQPSKLDGQQTPANQHFATFNFSDGNWHEVVGYVLPSAAPADAKAPADTTEIVLKAPAAARTANLFFLNFYNNGTPVTVWIAKPAIREVQPSR